MGSIEETIWCDGCGVEITWGPFVVDNRLYCCQDCQSGLVCHCRDRMDQEDERRVSDQTATVVAVLYSD